MINNIPNLINEIEKYSDFDEFKQNVAFVDIETTGLSKERNIITVLGIHNTKPNIFVHGINLEDSVKELEKAKYLITFNGNRFDLPFIHKHLPFSKNYKSIDLMVLFHRLGMYGGLKKIEQNVGISRDVNIVGMDGKDAITLWNKYCKGDKIALKTLIQYNIEDILNLEILLNYLYYKSISQKVEQKHIDYWRKEIYSKIK